MGFEGEIGKFGKPEGIQPPRRAIEGDTVPVRLSPKENLDNRNNGEELDTPSENTSMNTEKKAWRPPTTPPVPYDDVLTRMDPTAVDFDPQYPSAFPRITIPGDYNNGDLETPEETEQFMPSEEKTRSEYEEKTRADMPRDDRNREFTEPKTKEYDTKYTPEKGETVHEDRDMARPRDIGEVRTEYTDTSVSPTQERMRNVEMGLRAARESFADWRVKRTLPMDHHRRGELNFKRLNAKSIVEAEKHEKRTPLARAAIYGSPLPAAVPTLLADRPVWALGALLAAGGLGYLSKDEKKAPDKFSFSSYSYILGTEAVASGALSMYADQPVTFIAGGAIAAFSATSTGNEIKNHIAVRRYPKYIKRLNKDDKRLWDNELKIEQLQKSIKDFEESGIDPRSVKPRVLHNMDRMRRELAMRKKAQKAAEPSKRFTE